MVPLALVAQVTSLIHYLVSITMQGVVWITCLHYISLHLLAELKVRETKNSATYITLAMSEADSDRQDCAVPAA